MLDEQQLKKKFGHTLRAMRKNKGYSQETFAEKTGLHRTYISDVERGDRNVSLINIFKLCEALDQYPSAFFKYLEEDNNYES